jgi:CcmD family protein
MSSPDRLVFLFVAYLAFWLLLAGFLGFLGRRHRALEQELRDLEARVGKPPPSGGGASGM